MTALLEKSRVGMAWSPSRVDELRRRAEAGENSVRIAAAMGISRSAVCGAARRFGIRVPRDSSSHLRRADEAPVSGMLPPTRPTREVGIKPIRMPSVEELARPRFRLEIRPGVFVHQDCSQRIFETRDRRWAWQGTQEQLARLNVRFPETRQYEARRIPPV